MPTELDIERWPRRDAYRHFSRFAHPWFSVCTRVDVAPLMQRLAERGGGRLMLAYHHAALVMSNRIEPFRYRLRDGGVWIEDRVDCSTTVLRDDGSFGFARLVHRPSFDDYLADAAQAIEDARAGRVPFDAWNGRTDLIYCTTLPWIHFTSFSHARPADPTDAIPRLAFGRIEADGARRWMPVQLDVHHALMDGAHAGQWVQGFEQAMAEPAAWL
ncbi:MAG: hypothetical protein JNN18_10025 [Rubrivivax sp.]|jgi:chloramphenicol O-acetyltransferase type A|nr:hypothetical protein [Rubrivivax sp.]